MTSKTVSTRGQSTARTSVISSTDKEREKPTNGAAGSELTQDMTNLKSKLAEIEKERYKKKTFSLYDTEICVFYEIYLSKKVSDLFFLQSSSYSYTTDA